MENLSHLPSISILHHVPVPVRNTNNLDNATDFQNIVIKNWHYLVIEIPLVVNPFSSSFRYQTVYRIVNLQIFHFLILHIMKNEEKMNCASSIEMTHPPVYTDQYIMQICQTITNLKN